MGDTLEQAARLLDDVRLGSSGDAQASSLHSLLELVANRDPETLLPALLRDILEMRLSAPLVVKKILPEFSDAAAKHSRDPETLAAATEGLAGLVADGSGAVAKRALASAPAVAAALSKALVAAGGGRPPPSAASPNTGVPPPPSPEEALEALVLAVAAAAGRGGDEGGTAAGSAASGFGLRAPAAKAAAKMAAALGDAADRARDAAPPALRVALAAHSTRLSSDAVVPFLRWLAASPASAGSASASSAVRVAAGLAVRRPQLAGKLLPPLLAVAGALRVAPDAGGTDAGAAEGADAARAAVAAALRDAEASQAPLLAAWRSKCREAADALEGEPGPRGSARRRDEAGAGPAGSAGPREWSRSHPDPDAKRRRVAEHGRESPPPEGAAPPPAASRHAGRAAALAAARDAQGLAGLLRSLGAADLAALAEVWLSQLPPREELEPDLVPPAPWLSELVQLLADPADPALASLGLIAEAALGPSGRRGGLPDTSAAATELARPVGGRARAAGARQPVAAQARPGRGDDAGDEGELDDRPTVAEFAASRAAGRPKKEEEEEGTGSGAKAEGVEGPGGPAAATAAARAPPQNLLRLPPPAPLSARAALSQRVRACQRLLDAPQDLRLRLLPGLLAAARGAAELALREAVLEALFDPSAPPARRAGGSELALSYLGHLFSHEGREGGDEAAEPTGGRTDPRAPHAESREHAGAGEARRTDGQGGEGEGRAGSASGSGSGPDADGSPGSGPGWRPGPSSRYGLALRSCLRLASRKLPPTDRTLVRLLLDAPALPPAPALERFLRALLEGPEEGRATLALVASRDLSLLRPPDREPALRATFALSRSVALPQRRDLAVQLSARRLYAAPQLRDRVLEAAEEAAFGAGPAGGGEGGEPALGAPASPPDDDGWWSDEDRPGASPEPGPADGGPAGDAAAAAAASAAARCALFCALCSLNAELLPRLLSGFAGAEGEGAEPLRAALLAAAPAIAAGLAKGGQLEALLSALGLGAHTDALELRLALLEALAAAGPAGEPPLAPAAALLPTAERLFAATGDARCLLPALPAAPAALARASLGRLCELPADPFLRACRSLRDSRALPPHELFAALHLHEPGPRWTKAAMRGVSACLAAPAEFPPSELARALHALLVRVSPPALLLRTLVQLARGVDALRPEVATALRSLATRRPWEDPSRWRGWRLAADALGPREAADALLTLPPPRLREALAGAVSAGDADGLAALEASARQAGATAATAAVLAEARERAGDAGRGDGGAGA